MRMWILKFMGLIVWGLFLFAPFVVRADEGFDTRMQDVPAMESAKDVLLSVGGFDLHMEDAEKLQVPLKDKWAVKLKAGKDTVLTNDQPALIRHDRVPLDDGEGKGMRVGVGLNYTF